MIVYLGIFISARIVAENYKTDINFKRNYYEEDFIFIISTLPAH